jgi:hypothetical protein
MPAYVPTDFTGQQWRRCKAINIAIDHDKKLNFTFAEEDCVQFSGNTFTEPAPGIAIDDLDGTMEIPVRNINTTAPTGATFTLNRIRRDLHSLYWMLAEQRDGET